MVENRLEKRRWKIKGHFIPDLKVEDAKEKKLSKLALKGGKYLSS